MHRGGVGAGHYFAFIRPTLANTWYEFNDNTVSEVKKSTAFSSGYGGFETIFEYKDSKIVEKSKINNASAYMLVYIREGEREKIM